MRIDAQPALVDLASPPARGGAWADRLGIGLSACCGLHCLVTPWLLVVLPAVGGWFANDWVHWAALALIGPVALWALWRGVLRSNVSGRRKWAPLGLGVAGLLVLTAGAWGHPDTCCPSDPLSGGYATMDASAWGWVGVNVLGSVLLVAGHGWNLLRLRGPSGEGVCGCSGCDASPETAR
ncbi:MAG: MerC domain-containing protein [Planctomycetota bacterium]